MKKNDDDMFRKERELLNHFEKVYKSNIYDFDELMNEYFNLGKAYRKLLKQTNKLIRISDRTQKELYNTRAELQNQYDYIDAELKKAAEHVKSLLPSPYYDETLSIDWEYEPSSQLGGDIFGYQFLDNKHLAIYVVDVCGHGIGPALHSVSVLNTIKFRSLPRTDFLDPGSVLSSLNSTFSMFDHNNLYFTMWYCVLDVSSGDMKFAGSGHPPMIRIDKDDDIILHKSTNPPVGSAPNFDFQYDSLVLTPGSRIFLYTDGVYEVKDVKGFYMDYEVFLDYLTKIDKSNKELSDIYDFAIDFSFNKMLEDDFTILKLAYRC